ncbi:serine hydrolase domain-containing protein [Dactylosporangium sp. NPDC005555]|uniref:serine hydrolase domain-containing protein n=1 Tax=Dactylosporangium sp. NPDC005555 TaxID=3154889 RepID=UPI0033BC62F2
MTDELRGRLDEAIAAGHLDGLHGVVAVRGGETVLEHYGTGADTTWNIPLGVVEFGPDTLHDLRSVTKSVTALLYGVALGEGRVPNPGASLLEQFPQYPDLAADAGRRKLTVGHALTMSLGLEWREEIPYDSPDNAEIAMELAADRYRYVLERPVVEAPGTRWHYCGGATALIGKLIADGTGQPLPEYARARLFEPLGIEHFTWIEGADGVASAASGLRLAPRDLARIGSMMLAEGMDLVPAGWLRTMLEPRLKTDWDAMYGYQWYLETLAERSIVMAAGNGGQRLAVVPELDLTVAITAGNYDDPEQWRTPAALLEQVILPALA